MLSFPAPAEAKEIVAHEIDTRSDGPAPVHTVFGRLLRAWNGLFIPTVSATGAKLQAVPIAPNTIMLGSGIGWITRLAGKLKVAK